jgi:iron-sulfur cluster assembly protein
MIQFSPSAISEIKRLQSKQQQSQAFLRLAVEPGGCSGLLYHLDFVVAASADDQQFPQQDLQVLIDPHSLTYLRGLTLDYSEDLMGGGFRFYNPQAQQTCGCGQSFALATAAHSPTITPPDSPHWGAGI